MADQCQEAAVCDRVALEQRKKHYFERINKFLVDVDKQNLNLERKGASFNGNLCRVEKEILQRGEELKRLIDIQVRSLLVELNSRKTVVLKEIEIRRDELNFEKAKLEGFKRCIEQVLNGSTVTTHAVEELDARADNLVTCIASDTEIECGITFVHKDLDWASSNVESNAFGYLSYISTSKQFSIEEVPVLIESIPFENHVCGVAALKNQIFVLLGESNQIKVFCSDTLTLQRSIVLNGVQHAWDIAGRKNVLFVSERNRKLLHRVELPKETITNWQVHSLFQSFSLTDEGNVLFTGKENALFEYTSAGTFLRGITLPQDLSSPQHALALGSSGDIVVCHADIFHGICLIDRDGRVTKSFKGTHGSRPEQLDQPLRLAASDNGFILVVDYNHNRVVILNSALEFVKEYIPASSGMTNIFRFCLNEEVGHLYLAEWNAARLSVFSCL